LLPDENFVFGEKILAEYWRSGETCDGSGEETG